jgi:putative addiction module component (TIGR02574 family)
MAIDLQRTIDDLRLLSVDQRLRVVEAIWDSLDDAVPTPVSPGQRAEINRRLDAYEAAPDDLLTWDQVLERLRKRA